MKSIDLDKMKEVLPTWVEGIKLRGGLGSIVMLNPAAGERDVMQQVAPGVAITELVQSQWDLRYENPGRWDVIWLSFTMMCAEDPALWIRNMLASAPNVWAMDIVEGWRGGPKGAECATQDLDVMRYHLPGHRAVWPHAYDLSRHNLQDFDVYQSDGPKNPRAFVAWLRRP